MSAKRNEESDSDSSDEDYCPQKVKEDLSEEESDDSCNDTSDNETQNQKRTKTVINKKTKRRKTQEESIENVSSTSDINLTQEEKKKNADSLWANFLNDTGTKPKPKTNNEPTLIEKPVEKPKEKKEVVTVTNIFDFAGEKVEVTKQVPVDSIDARLAGITSETSEKKSTHKFLPKKGGMQTILGQINKKTKISTLEKSKLDWDGFKRKQGIEEEIQNHNKGKNGYLERQDFLERADLRQFEIEKEMRMTRRSNR